MERYNKEYDFYFNLARKVEEELGKRLRDSGVRCIVSSRAKSPDRLKVKITGRNEKNNYKKVGDVFDDIIDLSGVRVAVYFPENMVDVDKIIKDVFKVEKEKTFPEDRSLSPSEGEYKKVFSGYNAKHYRVSIKGDTRYSEKHPVEIQVASVLMHAWSEVEHDLVYKPFQGNLSREEHMILDEINGLVLAGNLALERLQIAGRTRTQGQDYEFKNHYDLTSYFISKESNIMVEGINFRSLFKILKLLGCTKRSDLDKLNTWMEKCNEELENVFDFRMLSHQSLVDYYKAMYAIVVVFHEKSINVLHLLCNDVIGEYGVAEEDFLVFSECIHIYLKEADDFGLAFSLSVIYNRNVVREKLKPNDSLAIALGKFNRALHGESEKLIRALEEYYDLIINWDPVNFTIGLYDRLVSLKTEIIDLTRRT